MSELGGKGDGGKGDGGGRAKKGGGFLDGLRSFGQDFLEAFGRNMAGSSSGAGASRAGKPVVSRKDPVTTNELPRAARQIHRTLKAQAQRAVDEKAAGEKDSDAPKADEAIAADGAAVDDEQQQQGADGAAADEADGGNAAPASEATAASDGADKKPEEGAKAEGDSEAAAGDDDASKSEEKPSLSVAAKLRGVHRKVFLAAKAPSSAAAPAGAGGAAQTNKVAFEPHSVPAASEKLELQAGASGAAKLLIGGKEGAAAFDGLALAFENATNRKGEDAVTTQKVIVVAAANSAKQVVVTDGKVDKAALDTAKAKLTEAASAVSTLLQSFKAATLAEAAQTKPAKSQTVQFEIADWMVGNKYAPELDRQLKLQADGMNAMTVDKWVANRETFAPSSVLNDLHDSAKQEILKKLEARCADGLPRAETRLKVVTKKREQAIAAQQALDAATTPEKQAKAAEEVAKALKEETQLAAEIQGFIDAAAQIEAGKQGGPMDPSKMKEAGGRENAQRNFADKHRAAKEKLVALVGENDQMVAEWEGLVSSTKDLAALHDPDQIAGGNGDIEEFPAVPEPADKSEANQAAVDEWKAYLEKVKAHFGVQKINGSIGSQWTKKGSDTAAANRIETLYTNVTTDADCPQEVHPLRTMNVSFTSAAK